MDVAGESSVRWHFLSSNNSVGKLCVSWALSLVECVTVWMPMLTHTQASHTDVLKTHSLQILSCGFTGILKDDNLPLSLLPAFLEIWAMIVFITFSNY